MICPKCGATVADNSQFCSNCGTSFSPAQPASVAAAPASFTGSPQTSGKAIASLVCGIINIFPVSIAAIILGHISLSEIKKSSGRLKGDGLAIAGLVLGYLGIVAIPFILIIAAIAIPNLLRARIAANEASAVAGMRELGTAEVSYQAAHQDAGFTCNFSDLSGMLDPQLSTGFKNGYAFFLRNCSAEKDGGPVSKFQILAIPKVVNSTGSHAFCTDETAVIRTWRGGDSGECIERGSPLE